MVHPPLSTSTSRHLRLRLAAVLYFGSRLLLVAGMVAGPLLYWKLGQTEWLAGGVALGVVLIALSVSHLVAMPLRCVACSAPLLRHTAQAKHASAAKWLGLSYRARVAWDVLAAPHHHCMYCHAGCRNGAAGGELVALETGAHHPAALPDLSALNLPARGEPPSVSTTSIFDPAFLAAEPVLRRTAPDPGPTQGMAPPVSLTSSRPVPSDAAVPVAAIVAAAAAPAPGPVPSLIPAPVPALIEGMESMLKTLLEAQKSLESSLRDMLQLVQAILARQTPTALIPEVRAPRDLNESRVASAAADPPAPQPFSGTSELSSAAAMAWPAVSPLLPPIAAAAATPIAGPPATDLPAPAALPLPPVRRPALIPPSDAGLPDAWPVYPPLPAVTLPPLLKPAAAPALSALPSLAPVAALAAFPLSGLPPLATAVFSAANPVAAPLPGRRRALLPIRPEVFAELSSTLAQAFHPALPTPALPLFLSMVPVPAIAEAPPPVQAAAGAGFPALPAWPNAFPVPPSTVPAGNGFAPVPPAPGAVFSPPELAAEPGIPKNPAPFSFLQPAAPALPIWPADEPAGLPGTGGLPWWPRTPGKPSLS